MTNDFTQLNLKFVNIYRLSVFFKLYLIGLGITASLILKPVFKTYKRSMLWSNVITHVHNGYTFPFYYYFVENPVFQFVWTF